MKRQWVTLGAALLVCMLLRPAQTVAHSAVDHRAGRTLSLSLDVQVRFDAADQDLVAVITWDRPRGHTVEITAAVNYKPCGKSGSQRCPWKLPGKNESVFGAAARTARDLVLRWLKGWFTIPRSN